VLYKQTRINNVEKKHIYKLNVSKFINEHSLSHTKPRISWGGHRATHTIYHTKNNLNSKFFLCCEFDIHRIVRITVHNSLTPIKLTQFCTLNYVFVRNKPNLDITLKNFGLQIIEHIHFIKILFCNAHTTGGTGNVDNDDGCGGTVVDGSDGLLDLRQAVDVEGSPLWTLAAVSAEDTGLPPSLSELSTSTGADTIFVDLLASPTLWFCKFLGVQEYSFN